MDNNTTIQPIKKQRNSSIELLRIILMFVIVLCHSSSQMSSLSMSGANKYFLQFTNLSNLMVDIFVLISGYFICKLAFSLKKVFLLLLQVAFYSVILYLVSIALKENVFSVKNFFLSFFPTITRQYWFVSAYVILYLLSPFINLLLTNISQKQHLLLIGTLIIIYSIVPTFTTFYQDGMDVFILITLYTIGAYLRLYPNTRLMQRRTAWILTLISASLYFGSVLALNIVGLKFKTFAQHPNYFLTKHCPFTITFAIGIFVLFVNWEIKSKFINLLGSCMFGVYLIHNSGYIRFWYKNDLFKFSSYASSSYFIPYIIGASLAVFVVCTIIELIRRLTLEKVTSKTLDKLLKKDK